MTNLKETILTEMLTYISDTDAGTRNKKSSLIDDLVDIIGISGVKKDRATNHSTQLSNNVHPSEVVTKIDLVKAIAEFIQELSKSPLAQQHIDEIVVMLTKLVQNVLF